MYTKVRLARRIFATVPQDMFNGYLLVFLLLETLSSLAVTVVLFIKQ